MGRGAALSGKRSRPVGCGLFAREGGAPFSMLLLRNENLQNLLKHTKEAAAAYIDTTDSPKLKGLTVAALWPRVGVRPSRAAQLAFSHERFV